MISHKFVHLRSFPESKALFAEEHVKFIIKQLQEPPSALSEADLPLHISNLLISFANICTFKFHSQYRAEVMRCQELLLQHGAIQATLNCLKNYEKHEIVRRSALSVLLKVERGNGTLPAQPAAIRNSDRVFLAFLLGTNGTDKVKDTFKTLGVQDEMIKVIRRSKNVMLKWLATAVLETFVRSGTQTNPAPTSPHTCSPYIFFCFPAFFFFQRVKRVNRTPRPCWPCPTACAT